MTYDEVIKTIKELPPFIPVRKEGQLLFDVKTVSALARELGDPQDKLKCVHIAGTNGKGSVAEFLSGIMTESGYKTGTFTSPYLERITEQIKIDGEVISDDEFADVFTGVLNAAHKVKCSGEGEPSEFEMCCVAAFLFFLREGCDICIIETGLGGRYDATNIISEPLLCIFTQIGFDHMSVLGDTLQEIADVKSGIIRNGCSSLSAPQEREVLRILTDQARQMGSELQVCEEPYDINVSLDRTEFKLDIGGVAHELSLGVSGRYQAWNGALSVAAAYSLRDNGFDRVNVRSIERGLRRVRRPGRFEVLDDKPVFIADGAHNPAGVLSLAESLSEIFSGRKCVFIAGMLADKDVGAMTEPLLSMMDRVYTITPDNPRAMTAKELAGVFAGKGVDAKSCGSACEAVDKARAAAGDDGVVVAFGSLYYLGELRRIVRQE